jgi:hypothetical protein
MIDAKEKAEFLWRVVVIHFELYRNARGSRDRWVRFCLEFYGTLEAPDARRATPHSQWCSPKSRKLGLSNPSVDTNIDLLMDAAFEPMNRTLKRLSKSEDWTRQSIESALLAHHLSFILAIDAEVLRNVRISERLSVWQLLFKSAQFQVGPNTYTSRSDYTPLYSGFPSTLNVK